ncbi:MAG: bifunctional adenosylcobinamide kinase/adenosylcobinamide-phosphate guanylyltransferase [Coleofasciculus sp. A1-SPW-01]|jgi:adenosylcobinamide kinase/adenosylcobinamide-phosphate guanylyltransferase|uniref:bifunctional adenosylcobinamide kinase/adenosylcobinamide-phosphate guanylyltransferase n=1 Tax=Coleofasciculus sp. A1-SPW-01 TaxID=3070819 RepID=UPI0032FD74DA
MKAIAGTILSMGQLILVTGPARSGKSEWAEQLADKTDKQVVYVATAQVDPNDLEWVARIEKHQQRRPAEWTLVWTPIDLVETILEWDQPDYCLLIDSLGTWVANCLDQEDGIWQDTTDTLWRTVNQSSATIILVAEETGWGVVPAYPLGRTFRDRLGQVVRQFGMIANPVYLVTGGHVLNLSTLGSPLSRESLP